MMTAVADTPAKNSHIKRNLTIIAVIFFVIFWSLVVFLYDAEEIVTGIGIHNGYTILFIVALIGAFSSFTPFTIYPLIVTFAIGGMNPFILGFIAGLGLSIGDGIFYIFGQRIRSHTTFTFRKRLAFVLHWIRSHPKWMTYLFIYMYIGFTPLPNNVLTGALALTGYPFRKVISPLILGDMTLPLLTAFMASQGLGQHLEKMF